MLFNGFFIQLQTRAESAIIPPLMPESPTNNSSKRPLSAFVPKVFLAVLCLVLSSCATETFAPDVAPEYVVIRDFSPFYRLGPQQGRGPDESLRSGTRVKLLRREMGYSLVQLEDSRTGYLANENMTVAPPRPPEQIKRDEGPAAGAAKKRGGRSRAEDSPVYSGPQVNDTPLPDPNIPPPDLNVEPEIMPANIPVPSATPSGTPKFRY